MRRLALQVVLFLGLSISPTHAQLPDATPQGPARAQPIAPFTNGAGQESIEIGLSTNRVRITSDFTGADLTIFGALDNADPLISRQGRYDVIVVLEGPSREVVVRRKSRVLGIWMNTRSETFVNVPISYSVATTRRPQDITTTTNYRQLSLGVQNIHLEPSDTLNDPESITEFTAALRDRKLVTGLFSENFGGVEFLSQNLFRATLRLAPDVPVGTHRARAFLFRNGVFVKETSSQLAILKSGFEQTVFRSAHDYSLLYGLFAVVLAVATGWLGRMVFRKD